MAYPLFSQPQGPAVQISLFGDAAQVGAKLGQQIPNPITSIIQGGIEGYETGQRIQANDQINELRQNQIDQLPIANQQQEIALENARIQAERNRLQLENETQNAGLQTDADAAKLKQQKSQSEYDEQITEKAKYLTNNFENLTPFQKEQVLLGGGYNDVFGKNPNLFRQFATSSYSLLSPSGKLDVDYRFSRQNIRDSNRAAAQKSFPQYQQTEAQLFYNNELTGQLVQNSKLAPSQIYQNPDTKFAPAGVYQTREDGKTLQLDSNGNPIRTQDAFGEKTTQWDVITKNPLTNKWEKIGTTTDPEQKKLFEKYVGLHALQSGANAKSELDVLDENYKKMKRGVTMPQPTGSRPTGTIQTQSFETPVSQESIDETLAKKTLNVSSEVYNQNKKSFEQINRFYTNYKINPAFRASPQAILTQQTYTSNLIENIASTEYENSPVIKEQYTEADVIKYNDNLVASTAKTFSLTQDFSLDSKEYYRQKIAPFLVKSPKDLYIKQRKETLQKGVQNYLDELEKYIDLKDTSKARNQTSQQKLASFASGE